MTKKQYTKEELKGLYGEEYVQNFAENKAQFLRIKNICSYINFCPNDVVADIGCGIGLLFDQCKHIVKEYHGVDFSESFINHFKTRIENDPFKPKVNLHCQDVVEFAGQNLSSFNKITTFDFSEHIYDDQFLEIYSSLCKSLTNDGVLYLHTPNKIFFIELLKDWGVLKQIPEHIAVRSTKEYKDLLSKAGFRRINVKYIPHYNSLKKLHPLSKIPLIGRLFEARILIEASK